MTVPFLFVFIWCSNALSDDSNIKDINKIRRDTRLLELEAKTAAKPVIYVVLELNKKKVYLKMKGITLKEFDIIEVTTFGKKYFNKSYNLVKRKEIFHPKRVEIKPQQHKDGNNASDNSQRTDTFDIEDMPSDYTLIFNEGLSISVISQFRNGFFLSVLTRINKNVKNLWNSSQLIWNYLKKNPSTKIQAVIDSDDARALYWALSEKVDFIVIGNL